MKMAKSNDHRPLYQGNIWALHKENWRNVFVYDDHGVREFPITKRTGQILRNQSMGRQIWSRCATILLVFRKMFSFCILQQWRWKTGRRKEKKRGHILQERSTAHANLWGGSMEHSECERVWNALGHAGEPEGNVFCGAIHWKRYHITSRPHGGQSSFSNVIYRTKCYRSTVHGGTLSMYAVWKGHELWNVEHWWYGYLGNFHFRVCLDLEGYKQTQ